MAYTNSSLVNYHQISPNRSSPRNRAIDTITIHCVVGQCPVETLGNIFAPTDVECSANYGIGYDGRIGMYVEEKDRSWCSSSSENDNRAVTIEVASDTYEPYRVNSVAYASLLNLVTDICRRNGIKSLVWSTDKDSRVNHRNGCNMTVHRDYANKSCPGDYLYNLHGAIATEVNNRLSKDPSPIINNPKTVKDIQQFLKNEGYNISVTDKYDNVTKRCIIKDMQVCVGNTANGIWSDADSNAYGICQNGDSGRKVKLTQFMLICRGYSIGTSGADGEFGDGTKNGVISFQRDWGLSTDGIIGYTTIKNMMS